MAAVRAGKIVIDISAGTAQAIADLENAKRKLGEVGEEARRIHSETGKGFNIRFAILGAKDLLEGRVGNTLAEGFNELASVGSVATAGIIAGVVGIGFAAIKVSEHLREMGEEQQRIRGVFEESGAPLEKSNDELQIANDKLDIHIAKLQGKPQNTLKLLLDEAKLAADNLAGSLDKDLGKLQELLKKENGSIWTRIFFGQAGLGNFSEEIGGVTGLGGFRGRIDDINREGTEKIAAARTEKEKDAAETERNTRLYNAYGEEIGKVSEKLSEAEILQKRRDMSFARKAETSYGSESAPLLPTEDGDQTKPLEVFRALRKRLESERKLIELETDHPKKEAENARAEAAKEAEGAQRPYQNRLHTLQAEIDAAEAKRNAAGKGFSDKQDAAAKAESTKILAELNNELGRHHQHLTNSQEATVRDLVAKKEALTVDTEWHNKLAQLNSTLADRVRGQDLLTASIGKGFQAARQAAVEMQLMQELGERYNDPKWMQEHSADVAGLRNRIGQGFDSTKREQATSSLDKISDQIELQRDLSQVQSQGAEAVRQVELQHRLADIAKNNDAESTKKLTAAERELYQEQRKNRSAENLANLNLEISATQRLASVQLQGAEATRRAELENKYDKMKRDGASPEEIRKTGNLDEAQHQREVTAEALKTGLAYQNQLESIAMQIEALKQLRAEKGGSLAIDISLHNLSVEQARVMSEQAQQLGTATQGMRAYFREMAASGQSAAKQVHDALSSAVGGVNDNLAKLISGQKVSWASFFQEQSAHLAKMGLEGIEAGIAGKIFGGAGKRGPMDEKSPLGGGGIGGVLGGIFGAAGGKRDGSSAATALYVTMSPLGGSGSIPGMTKPFLTGDFSDGEDSAGGFLGKISGIFKKFGGFFAEGGDISPGSAYMVGENGPEMFSPRSSGTIIPNHMLGGGQSGDVYIDARNADPAAVQRSVQRGMQLAHNSSVRTSFRSYQEYGKRTPPAK